MRFLHIVFYFFFLWPARELQAQTKRALLIGVSTYADDTWKSLSAANDISYLKTALRLQGFNEAHIALLSDAQATFRGIDSAMEAMVQQLKPDDIVYVHFSGHGQQIEDNPENPDEADGYDEALVPFDAFARYDPVDYPGQNHYRDDRLGEWLEKMRARLGPEGSLFAVIDACHSGTATRSSSFAVVRGDPKPFQSPEYQPKLSARISASSEAFLGSTGAALSNMVVFSASSPNQVNYETRDAEGKGVGSLSYALAMALQRMEQGATYEWLFGRVKSLIQVNYPQQIPVMEGNGTQQVFAGKFKPKDQRLKVDYWLSDTVFTVAAGKLQGIYPGTVFKIQDPSGGSVSGLATVKESDAVNSRAAVNRPLNKTVPYVLELSTPGVPAVAVTIKVSAGKGVPKPMAADLQEFLRQQPGVLADGPADFLLELTQVSGSFVAELVETGDALRFRAVQQGGTKLADSLKTRLGKVIKAASRARFMRLLPDGGPQAAQVTAGIEYSRPKTPGGEWNIPQGGEYSFYLINKSANRLYYNIVNVLPTNEVQVLLPQPGENAMDYSIGPGQEIRESGYGIEDNAALGKELLRVVLSPRPIDLRPVFDNTLAKGATRGGMFEQWLHESMAAPGQAPRTRSGTAEEITLVSTGFTIVAK